MNVGRFLNIKTKRTSDTDSYKGYFSSARVFQINIKTMERTFELRSELQVAKSLIVHVLSLSCNVSSLELPDKKHRAATEFSCSQRFCTQSGLCIS